MQDIKKVKEINWKLVLGDVGMEARRLMWLDPDYRQEMKELHDPIQKLIDEAAPKEEEIKNKYYKKYLAKVIEEKKLEEDLVQEYLNREFKGRIRII
jgi:cyclopropane fatty-acyl-phospholipid synthase-like methyltransferase